MASTSLFEPCVRAPLLNLGKTALLVLPGARTDLEPNLESKDEAELVDEHSSRVVQVTVEAAQGGKKAREADTIAAFFLVQHEISNLITSILRTHSTHPLLTPIRFVQSEGSTPYTLTAENRPWPYGKSLGLVWGNEHILPSAVKWTFWFAVQSDDRHTTQT